MSTSNLQPEDKRAAMTGMVITAVSLFIMAFTIVLLTNRKFAGKEHEKAATTQAQH